MNQSRKFWVFYPFQLEHFKFLCLDGLFLPDAAQSKPSKPTKLYFWQFPLICPSLISFKAYQISFHLGTIPSKLWSLSCCLFVVQVLHSTEQYGETTAVFPESMPDYHNLLFSHRWLDAFFGHANNPFEGELLFRANVLCQPNEPKSSFGKQLLLLDFPSVYIKLLWCLGVVLDLRRGYLGDQPLEGGLFRRFFEHVFKLREHRQIKGYVIIKKLQIK